uniref:Aldedh domain-containing protein n=1 Tax=Rhabditophanes sp. KR3021 TaxID=114890 RepID=A0AC35U5A0_9BILA
MFKGGEVGDIIIYSRIDMALATDLEKDILESVAKNLKNNDFHCGIISQPGFVIETTTTSDGVIECSIESSVVNSKCCRYDIYFVDIPLEIKLKAVKWARAQLGVQYNHVFDPLSCFENKSIKLYCSQLVAEAYKFASNGREVFVSKVMEFGVLENRGWRKYFKQHDRQVPVNTLGTHPHDFRLSEHTNVVYSECTDINLKMASNKLLIPKDLCAKLNFVSNKLVEPTNCILLAPSLLSPRNGGSSNQPMQFGDKKFVSDTVCVAKEAHATYKKTSLDFRKTIFLRVGRNLRERVADIAKMETKDNGKPITESIADVLSAADCVEFFASSDISGKSFPLDPENGQIAYTVRESFGVVGCIGAWNYPIQTAMWKIAPALICGNTIVYKPSPLTPMTSTLLGLIFAHSGLPAGVLNIIQGDAETAEQICLNEDVKKISFTGSLKTGRRILQLCSSKMIKPATMELGGKGSLVIFEDADIESATNCALMANFYSQGQVCSNASKVLVHTSILEEFTEMVVSKTKKMVIGDPLDEKTHVGASISAEHLQNVKKFIDDAVTDGARVLCGGEFVIPSEKLKNGFYISPCILTDVNPSSRAYKDEIFGPVMLIIPFSTKEEAMEIANESKFGLAHGVFTNKLDIVHQFIDALEAGTVYVNTFNNTSVHVPFGGINQSGFGREQGHAAIEAWSQLKSVYINTTGQLKNPFE